MGEYHCIMNAVFMGVLFSLLMPHILLYFAEPEDVKLPLQLDGLSMNQQLMHLMAHKSKMPLLSALIVGTIVGLSVYLGYKLNPLRFKQ